MEGDAKQRKFGGEVFEACQDMTKCLRLGRKTIEYFIQAPIQRWEEILHHDCQHFAPCIPAPKGAAAADWHHNILF